MTDQNQTIQTVAVVGAGTVGASWALLFATHGLTTRMYDQSADALQTAEAFLDSNMALLVRAGLLDDVAVGAVKALISTHTTLRSALEDAQFVQESAFENYDVKRQLFQLLDAFCPPEVLLASSSSGLLMSEIQAGLAHPERCLIAHPINPPHLVPLVELAPGRQTDPAAIERARVFYLALGKTPVVLRKEAPGHIANRLAVALWREAINLAVEGVASVADIDRAISAGPGLRWALLGQHMIYHLNGGPGGMAGLLAHFGPSIETWWRDLATWTELPPGAAAVLTAGIEEELGGRSYQELQEWRDQALLNMLDALRRS
jgi:3-hydroxyacyl-CoA dehydrogenase